MPDLLVLASKATSHAPDKSQAVQAFVTSQTRFSSEYAAEGNRVRASWNNREIECENATGTPLPPPEHRMRVSAGFSSPVLKARVAEASKPSSSQVDENGRIQIENCNTEKEKLIAQEQEQEPPRNGHRTDVRRSPKASSRSITEGTTGKQTKGGKGTRDGDNEVEEHADRELYASIIMKRVPTMVLGQVLPSDENVGKSKETL